LKDADLATFIRAPGTIVGARRECGPDEPARVRYAHLPDLWNQYVLGYRRHLPVDQTLILRYEDTLTCPIDTFGRVMDRTGLTRSKIKLYQGRRFQSEVSSGVGRNYAEAVRYYTDPQNRLKDFNLGDIAFIEQKLDSDMLKHFGYAGLGVCCTNRLEPALLP